MHLVLHIHIFFRAGHGKLLLGDRGYYEGTFVRGEIEGHGYRWVGRVSVEHIIYGSYLLVYVFILAWTEFWKLKLFNQFVEWFINWSTRLLNSL